MGKKGESKNARPSYSRQSCNPGRRALMCVSAYAGWDDHHLHHHTIVRPLIVITIRAAGPLFLKHRGGEDEQEESWPLARISPDQSACRETSSVSQELRVGRWMACILPLSPCFLSFILPPLSPTTTTPANTPLPLPSGKGDGA